jgi:cholinesterase
MGGASHGAEVNLLFHTQPASIPDTPAEVSIGAYMRGAWAAFAEDSENGLSNYGWPVYNSLGNNLVRLGYNNVTGANLAGSALCDTGCPP